MGNNLGRKNPAFAPPTPPSYSLETFSDLQLVEGRVPIRFIAHSRGNDVPTILYTHGNASDLGQAPLEKMSLLFEVNICAYDYAGYGVHQVRIPSEDDCFLDIRDVYAWLIENKGIPKSKIILYGQSLGSGPTCYLAELICTKRQIKSPNIPSNERAQLGGLILHSPIESALRVLSHSLSNVMYPLDFFENYKRAPNINCTTLVIHGDSDEVVQFSNGENLSKLFPTCQLWKVIGAGHNNIERNHSEAYIKQICQFVEACQDLANIYPYLDMFEEDKKKTK